jgi:hypothetical protein
MPGSGVIRWLTQRCETLERRRDPKVVMRLRIGNQSSWGGNSLGDELLKEAGVGNVYVFAFKSFVASKTCTARRGGYCSSQITIAHFETEDAHGRRSPTCATH